MSDSRSTTLRVSVGDTEVSIQIHPGREPASTSSHGGREWEIVGEPEGESARLAVELVPSTGAVPLHLVRRARLASRSDWTPQRRLERAFEFGKQDAECALEGRYQAPRDSFPIQTAVYVILYDPSGNWPRITRSSANYFRAVQEPLGIWRKGIVLTLFSEAVDLLLLKWPVKGEGLFLAIPCRVCDQGIILALPVNALPTQVLDEAAEGAGDGLVGPSWVTTVAAQGAEEDTEPLEILLVEFRMNVRLQLERRNPRTRRTVVGFTQDLRVLPDFRELDDAVSGWIETGEERLEDYFTAAEELGINPPPTGAPQAPEPDRLVALMAQLSEIKEAMDSRFAKLEGRVDQAQSKAAGRAGATPKASNKPPSPAGGGVGRLDAGRDRMETMLDAVRSQVNPPPPRTQDEPGRTGETAVAQELLQNLDGDAAKSGASTDDLLKIALVKMLQGKQTKRSRKLPGLPSWEESESSDGEAKDGGAWSSTSKGGRGIEAVEKLNAAMRSHPEAYQERMESRMMRAIEASELTPMVPLQFAKTCPVGRSRTAGYCLQGFAQTHKLLLENKPKQARLHVLRMMSALEQFLIDENWAVASRITGMEEPPWGHWSTQDLGALRRQYVYTRLSEATWIGALINELKEEEWLVKKRAAVPSKAKGGGKAQGDQDGATDGTFTATQALPVVAERLSLPESVQDFDPLPFLSPTFRQIYEKPDDFLKDESEMPEPIRVRGTATRAELLKVMARWDALGRLFVCKGSEVSSKDRCELFAVGKDETKDRQILHRKRRNLRERHVAGASRDLPHGVLLCQLPLEGCRICACSVDDVKDFYHAYKASEARARSSPVGPLFRSGEVAHLTAYQDALAKGRVHSGDMVACCFKGLGMGDHAAVDIAQESHVNLLRAYGAMKEGEVLKYRDPVPHSESGFLEGIMIDDHLGLQMLEKKKTMRETLEQPGRDQEVFAAAETAYRSHGLQPHPKKRVRRDLHSKVWGAEMEGGKGLVGPARGRLLGLAKLSSEMAQTGPVDERIVEGVLGLWGYCAQYRRPMYSFMFEVYRQASPEGTDKPFRLTSGARNEFGVLACLAPLCLNDLNVLPSPDIFCVDASPSGAGVCRARVGVQVSREIWRRGDKMGFRAPLLSKVSACLKGSGWDEEAVADLLDESEPEAEIQGGPGTASDRQFQSPSSFAESYLDTFARHGWRLAIPSQLGEGAFDFLEVYTGDARMSAAWAAEKFRVLPPLKLDEGCDFKDQSLFWGILGMVRCRRVKFVWLSPPRTSFSPARTPRLRSWKQPWGLQLLDKATMLGNLHAAQSLLLVWVQAFSGLKFALEQPALGVLRSVGPWVSLLKAGAFEVMFDWCQYDCDFRKSTRMLTNFEALKSLSSRCRHRKSHGTPDNNHTSDMQSHSEAFCKQVVTLCKAVWDFEDEFKTGACHEEAAAKVVRSSKARQKRSSTLWAVQLSESLRWRTIMQYRFRTVTHINIQEAKARRSLVKRMQGSSRVVVCQDSRVNLGALGKGRSPSEALNAVMRTEAPHLLGKNLYLSGVHLPTWSIRADAPSRSAPVEEPRAPVPSWFWQLRRGSAEARRCLDDLQGLPRALNRWFLLGGALLLRASGRGASSAESGPSVTEKTHAIRTQLILDLEAWLLPQVPGFTVEMLARSFTDVLSEWLEEYMIFMFLQNKSRRAAAETLNALAQQFGWLRSSLAGPWNVIRTWEGLEPVQHHPPISAPILRALVVTALLWKWRRLAVVLVLGFFGLLRPSELICLRRHDLSLPEDHLEGEVVYIRVGHPKTRNRAAHSQHVRVDEPGVAAWVSQMISSTPMWRRIWNGSWAAFKHRFNLLQIEVLNTCTFLPSSLRPGGATYLFRQWDENLPRLQWRGRWRSFRMLEIYVQELGDGEPTPRPRFPTYQSMTVKDSEANSGKRAAKGAAKGNGPPLEDPEPGSVMGVQPVLNLARKAELKVQRLTAGRDKAHKQWAVYDEELKQTFLREKRKFTANMQRLDKEIAEALKAQDLARQAVYQTVAGHAVPQVDANQEEEEMDWDRTREAWEQDDGSDLNGVLSRALAHAGAADGLSRLPPTHGRPQAIPPQPALETAGLAAASPTFGGLPADPFSVPAGMQAQILRMADEMRAAGKMLEMLPPWRKELLRSEQLGFQAAYRQPFFPGVVWPPVTGLHPRDVLFVGECRAAGCSGLPACAQTLNCESGFLHPPLGVRLVGLALASALPVGVGATTQRRPHDVDLEELAHHVGQPLLAGRSTPFPSPEQGGARVVMLEYLSELPEPTGGEDARLAVLCTPHQGLDYVMDAVLQAVPGADTQLYDRCVPARPMQFRGWCTLILFPSIAARSPDGTMRAVIVDLTFVGGHYYACFLPEDIDFEELLHFATMQASYSEVEMLLHIG
ncbi:unnamed protein product [Symbiodinium sp. CCMP2592]|nr:unnamed protein product [Symbiodinium sp. CCMP2592]